MPPSASMSFPIAPIPFRPHSPAQAEPRSPDEPQIGTESTSRSEALAVARRRVRMLTRVETRIDARGRARVRVREEEQVSPQRPTLTDVPRVAAPQPSLADVARVLQPRPTLANVPRAPTPRPSLADVARVLQPRLTLADVPRVVQPRPTLADMPRAPSPRPSPVDVPRVLQPRLTLADVLARAAAPNQASSGARPQHTMASSPAARVLGSWNWAQEDAAIHGAIQNNRSLPEIIGGRMMRTYLNIAESLSGRVMDGDRITELHQLSTLRHLVQSDENERISRERASSPTTRLATAFSALGQDLDSPVQDPAPTPDPVSVLAEATGPVPDLAADESLLGSLTGPPIVTVQTPIVNAIGDENINPWLTVTRDYAANIPAAPVQAENMPHGHGANNHMGTNNENVPPGHAANNATGPVNDENVAPGLGIQPHGLARARNGIIPEFGWQYDNEEPEYVTYENLGDCPLKHLRLARDRNDCDWCEHDWTDPAPTVDMPILTFQLQRPDDVTVTRICERCATTRLNIIKHARHGPWIAAYARRRQRQESRVNLDNGQVASACDVCTSLAVYACKYCPLLVCGDCQRRLNSGCLRSVDRLILDLGPHNIRKDAVIISSMSLESFFA